MARKAPWWVAALVAVLTTGGTIARAGEADLAPKYEELRKSVLEQAKQLEAQNQLLEAQQWRIQELENLVKSRVGDIQAIRDGMNRIAAQAKAGPHDLRVFWKQGLRFQTV